MNDSFEGRCPTCGQAYLAARIAELERELAEAREVAVRNATDCQHLRQSAITMGRELAEARQAIAELERDLAADWWEL